MLHTFWALISRKELAKTVPCYMLYMSTSPPRTVSRVYFQHKSAVVNAFFLRLFACHTTFPNFRLKVLRGIFIM